MAIRVKNLDRKSSLGLYELSYSFSAGSDTISNNLGVVTEPCRLQDVLIGNTASAIGHVIAIRVNNVAYQTVTVSAITVSGGVIKQPGAASPTLISAGSYIECRTSATAGTTPLFTKLRFKIAERSGK